VIEQVLTEGQKEARAINAVAKLFEKRLIVPKIYFQAPWPDQNNRVDLLAVDRAGIGDIHAVEVKVGTGGWEYSIAQVLNTPAHYRYIALYEAQNYRPQENVLYASDGFGRLGVIIFDETPGRELRADMWLSPERFRLSSDFVTNIDRFTARNKPDMEARP
jgi:hypothetical protein